MTGHIYLLLGWSLFYFLHSLLASVQCKKWVEQRYPHFVKYYRIVYNLFALLTFTGLFFIQWTLPSVLILILPNWVQLIAWTGILSGIWILYLSFRNYSLREFSGIEQWRGEDQVQAAGLQTGGLNAWVRHPIYFGVLLLLLGYFLKTPDSKNLILTCVTFVYIPIGAMREEKKLLELFGEDYRRYRLKVKMLIPYFL